MHETNFSLGAGSIFTLMFVMLGPLKVIGPFAKLTHEMDDAARKKIAVRAFVIALVAVIAGALVGRALLQSWSISPPALLLAGGAIFFVVGMRVVLEQYSPASTPPPHLPDSPMAAAMRIAFPTVVTPYGTASVIVLLAHTHEVERMLTIFVIVVGVMLLNLVAMLFARRILGGVTAIVLEILGAVLGVLQVALAVTIILYALHDLGVMNA
ncbi:MarC family protein [Variovorax sp. J2P1-59]|uniref:MarC family protein n=1 Tax=Variovorax flavidus TaxID=3053501 RepID=UPI002579046E|nr:MarC family protein [Variovorax sp. J2P1-59]MDM0076632.1 MarC family protein [Variovorax sp. J2P1-59]